MDLRRLLDSPRTWLVLAAILVLLAFLSTLEVRRGGLPSGSLSDVAALRDRDDLNVLFVLIDTLRADRLGAYGYERPTSPALDSIAARGIRFANCEAQSSWTKASMASLWTGLFPPSTGVTRFDHVLPEQALLPAEILKQAGFATAGVFRNGWVAANFGFGQGFDAYVRPATTQTPARFERRSPGAQLLGTDEDATRSALAFLDSRGHERFLLYVHYMDVHQYAYDDAAAALGFGSSYSDAYDAAIRWTDRNVGALLAELQRRGLSDRTLVVVASDHGEGFEEHGQEGHARTLYREVTHVPLLIGLPFRLPEPVVVESMVRNVDIWPTVLDLLGLGPLPDVDGRSLVPLILGEAPDVGGGPPALALLDRRWGRPDEPPAPLASLRTDASSVILAPEEKEEIVGVFDLAHDPRELEDLHGDAGAGPGPDWERPLESDLRARLEQKPPWAVPSVELDALYREQLRALGYVVH